MARSAAALEPTARTVLKSLRSPHAIRQPSHHAFPSNGSLTQFSQPFSTTPLISAPPNPSLFSLGSSSSSSGAPSSYFQRASLPANTIVRFVPQQTAWIVERMGKYNRILQPGLAIMIPLIDRIAYVKSLKENAIEIPSQSAITADNVTLELDGVLYTRVFDAYKARYIYQASRSLSKTVKYASIHQSSFNTQSLTRA